MFQRFSAFGQIDEIPKGALATQDSKKAMNDQGHIAVSRPRELTERFVTMDLVR
jgi:hypothetical protein